MNRKLWWLLYSLLLAGYLYVSWPVFQYTTTNYQFLEYEHIPVMTVPQMKAELKRLEYRVNNPGDPTQYCEDLMDLRLLNAAAVKRDLTGPLNFDVRVIAGRANDLMQTNFQTYFNKHGSTVMGYATAAYWNANPGEKDKYRAVSSKMPFLAHLLYLNALPFVAVFYLMRLHANGYSLLGELRHRPFKIVYAIACWPLGIFIYPTGEPVKLIINWVRVRAQALGYALASTITLFVPGAIKAQEKPLEKKQTSTTSLRTDSRVLTLTAGGQAPNPPEAAQTTTTEKKSGGCIFPHLALELFPVVEDGLERGEYVVPEYAWVCPVGKGFTLSGFGFLEIRKDDVWFTSHSVNLGLPGRFKFLAISTEQGGVPYGGKRSAFLQAGPRISLTQAPLVGRAAKRVFVFFNVAHYRKLAGIGIPNETLFAWETRDVPIGLGPLRLSSAGFYRVRGGGRGDYGQPQVWLRPKPGNGFWSKVAFGTELETAGGKVHPHIGIKVFLK